MFRRITIFLGKAEESILSLMVLQMGLSIFLQVVMRYAFNAAITWLDELVHLEVVFLAFFGAGLGLKHGAHISVDILRNILKEPYLRYVEALNHLIIFVYCAVIIYYGSHLISLMTQHVHYTPTLRIPKHYLYAVVCFALAIMGLRSLLAAVRRLNLLGMKPGNETAP